jgi:hypothetical protein
MSLELLDAHQTTDGIAVTFVTERGIEPLEGSCDEVARLAHVMQQVGALASLNEEESVWLEEVAVGDAVVKLGLNPGRQARVRILRSHS